MFKLVIKKKKNIKNDILSGITVALALVPEAVAFSFVARVDPKVGLYAAFMMGLVTAVLGGRPGMISGATGAVAVIFAPLVVEQTRLLGLAAATEYLFAAVILMGLIQIVFGWLKLGKFVRLIPHPVMLGFVNGLAIIIFKSQFAQFYIGDNLLPLQPLLIMVGLIMLTMFITQFLPRITKAIPASLLSIIVVTIIGKVLGTFGFDVITVLDFVKNIDPSKSTIAASLPTFMLPQVPFTWQTIKIIFPYASLAAAVGLIESLMTLTLIDELTETRGKGNRESVGQGIANVVNGFFGGMGGCAMIGQSMINIRSGGRGRLSGIMAAMTLLFFVLFGASFIEQVPLAALVGIMFMVVIATFEWSSFRIVRKIPKSDAFIVILVSVVTVLVDLAVAVILGCIVAALIFAWEQGKKVSVKRVLPSQNRVLYEVRGAIFFGSVSMFKDLFFIQDDPKDIEIDFSQARVYDHSGLEAMNNIAARYGKLGKRVHFLHVSPECEQLINKSDNVCEISILKKARHWHIADDRLA